MMACTTSIRFIISSFLLCVCLLFALKGGHAFEEIGESYFTHTIQVSSLYPSPVCNHSSKADERMATLRVVDKFGPCFQPDGVNKSATPSLKDILRRDRARVNSIHSRLLTVNSGRLRRDMLEVNAPSTPPAPVIDGDKFGTPNFVVKVGLGTPKAGKSTQEFSLVIDTGSDLTWTQCQPCEKCYSQVEKIFDPTQSTTYLQIPKSDPVCKYVKRPSNLPPALDSKCIYKIEYADGGTSIGYFSKDTLTFSKQKIQGFLFGCGYKQQGDFNKEAGMMGLSQESASIVLQTANTYKKVFSYCLPSSTSSTGHLTFGGSGSVAKAKYIKLNTKKSPYYGVDLIGINLGGKKLAIDESLFKKGGTIVDSGTVYTYLPPKAFTTLRDEFRAAMKALGYTMVAHATETCYDFSKQTGTIKVPVISFLFSGNIVLDIPEKSSLIPVSKYLCLAFEGNDDDDDESIIGNQVQRTMEVVYDIPGNRIGFAPGGCS